MTRFILGAMLGATLTFFAVADHYGHILRGDLLGGLACRWNGLSSVRVGDYGHTKYLCADLTYATPENDLWELIILKYKNMWSLPR